MSEYRWPRELFRRMSEPYKLFRGSRERKNGEVIWNFGPSEKIYAFIRPPERSESMDFSIEGSGETTNLEYFMDVLEKGQRSKDATNYAKYFVDPPIENGDRVIYDNKITYRVVDPTFENHEGVGRYALVRDYRGESSADKSSGSKDKPYKIA